MNDATHTMPAPAAAPRTMGEEVLNDLLSRDPESMPEVLRELTMLRGAVDGLERLTDELRARLAHVTRLPEPHDTPPQAFPEVDSTLAHSIRDIYSGVSRVEASIGGLLGHLAV